MNKNKPKQKRKQNKKIPTTRLLEEMLAHHADLIVGVVAEIEKLKFIASHRMQLNFGLGTPLIRRVAKIEKHLLKFAHEFEIQNDVILENVGKEVNDDSTDDPTIKSVNAHFGSNPAAN